LALTPLDLLFFRDGRPFEAAAQVRSGQPTPQTVAGALRTWLLRAADCDFERLAKRLSGGCSFAEALEDETAAVRQAAACRFRGPWFGREREKEGNKPAGLEPLLAAPAILRRRKGKGEQEDAKQIFRLAPLNRAPPGWCVPHGLMPLWTQETVALEAVQDLVTLAGMKQFLSGDLPAENQLVARKDLFDEDRRVSVSIGSETRTGRDGQIFAVGFLALKPGVCLLAEIEGPPDLCLPSLPAVIPLGGEGRRVRVERVNSIDWPAAPAASGKSGRLVLLTTPALIPDGGLPAGWSLAAAAVPRPKPVSGWDLARAGPKPTRFAVPAGTVYFLKSPPNGSDVSQSATAPRAPLCTESDSALGWGCWLEGIWTHCSQKGA
jgi:CRISPR-associated protein Cmr3